MPDHELIVLNPAGYSPSRSWPTNHYIEFAKTWLKQKELTQFVLLLLPSMQAKANTIADALGSHCINLTGKANQVEAFAILQKCKFLLSEDSGLMHMAWVQGIPTLALFSSSRKDWSAPQGEKSYCLDSSDLECGPCMLEVCKFGDNRCLTRYAPEFVLDKAKALTSPKSI
jgi:ADP-heptose:LPS heptosyltransferase